MINNYLETTCNNNTYEPLSWSCISLLKEEIRNDYFQDVCILLQDDSHIRIVICKALSLSSPMQLIIAKNHYWTRDEENFFDELIKEEKIAYNSRQFREVYMRYSQNFPEWNLKFYSETPLRMLDHIRHCLNPSGVKEILYKTGLDELAANLSSIDDYNIIGSTPEEILGLSTRTLRAINCPHGHKLISTEVNRQKLATLQNTYSYLFSMPWTPFMCQYMETLLLHKKNIENIIRHFEIKFGRASVSNSSQTTTHTNVFQMQEEIIKEIGEKLAFEIPTDQIRRYHKFLVKDKDYWNQEIEISNDERISNYELTDVNYAVTYPETIKEFVLEAVSQKTDLLNYLKDYVRNDTDILFLRKTDHKQKPYVTIEIYDGRLVQAFGKDNTKPDEQVLKWLEIYAKIKNLSLELNYIPHNED